MSAPLVRFRSSFAYDSRESKARYVWEKYREILQGSKILDVGADECHLKRLLDDSCTYWGIGLGGRPDQQVNLEKEGVPFPENSFDTVVCLDVLEHVENPQVVMDGLCRVARHHVIISLPNPWSDLWTVLRHAPYSENRLMKYYGFPHTHPGDRHKWFFCSEESRAFIEACAERNRMHVLQMDHSSRYQPPSGLKGLLHQWAVRILIRPGFSLDNLYDGPVWAVLQKEARVTPCAENPSLL